MTEIAPQLPAITQLPCLLCRSSYTSQLRRRIAQPLFCRPAQDSQGEVHARSLWPQAKLRRSCKRSRSVSAACCSCAMASPMFCSAESAAAKRCWRLRGPSGGGVTEHLREAGRKQTARLTPLKRCLYRVPPQKHWPGRCRACHLRESCQGPGESSEDAGPGVSTPNVPHSGAVPGRPGSTRPSTQPRACALCFTRYRGRGKGPRAVYPGQGALTERPA